MDGSATTRRLDFIDGLRGLALLGILWVNLPGHAYPYFAIFDPHVAGGTDPVNLAAWIARALFVEGAMRGLFSLLFGASVILFTWKAMDAMAPVRTADLYLRRNLWLAVFGLVHGFLLLMPGDILYTYGVAGMVLFVFRLASSRQLLVLAGLCALVLATIQAVAALETAGLRDAVAAAGGPDAAPPELAAAWASLNPPPDQLMGKFAAVALGSYWDQLAIYGAEYATVIFSTDFIFYLVDALMMMFIGMALMKSGRLGGTLPLRTYLVTGAIATVAGLALRGWAITVQFRDDFLYLDWGAAVAAEIGRPLLAIGYALLFILLWKINALGYAKKALSAVGRLAFTQYIGGTLIAIVLFYGFGFGLFGRLDRIEVYGVVAAACAVQIVSSLVWLRFFRIGPLEWAWRSLVHLDRLPITRPATPPTQGDARVR